MLNSNGSRIEPCDTLKIISNQNLWIVYLGSLFPL